MSASDPIGLALSLQGKGQFADAEAVLRKLLQRTPRDAVALNVLSIGMLNTGRPANAVESIRKALVIEPDDPQAHFNLGIALRMLNDRNPALRHFREARRLQPDNHQALVAEANLLHETGQHAEAVELFELAVSRQRNDPFAWLGLGNARCAIGDRDAGVAALRNAVSIAPNLASALNDLGAELNRAHESDEALELFRRATRADPDHALAWLNLGMTLDQFGEDASEALQNAVKYAPGNADAWFQLVHLHGRRVAAGEIEAMVRLERDLAEGTLQHALLCFALGRAHHDQKQYDRAFAWYEQAHESHRKRRQYSEDGRRQAVDDLLRTFPISQPAYSGGTASLVFVVGMPRSGTSLCEQILASHPAVRAMGETSWLQKTLSAAPFGKSIGYPSDIERLSVDELDTVRRRIINGLGGEVGDQATIVETTPTNLNHVGLILTLFPAARIVHCRRDARDTCLSIYQQALSDAHAYSDSLPELGRYCLTARELAAHWMESYPDSIFDLEYESVVKRPEETIQQLLSFCGLEFHDSCLEFYKQRRPVRTPSAGQVRTPVYASSVGRWRNYEEHLGPLLEVLGDVS